MHDQLLQKFGNIHIDDKEMLNCILDNMMDGVMVVNADAEIVSFNKAAEVISGYKAEEVIGKDCSILDTNTCSLVKERKNRCVIFSKGKVSNKQCQIKNKNGKLVHLLKNAMVLKDDQGKVFGAVETMTDVTSLFMKELELQKIKEKLRDSYSFMGMVGLSSSMQKVFELIQDAAESDIPVMIFGESGTGKELVANAIHSRSSRASEPFIKVNCAALSESLLESELFGHKKGAFTGAIENRRGRFEAAHRGSIFLDEIGDIPLSMQVKLLRVLQEKEIERVGDNTPVKVDVRVISATNRDLSSLVDANSFREDLFYRVNVFPVHIPPLREKLEDLPLLVSHFLKSISIINQKNIRTLTPEAFERLESYSWPGNIRQLINCLEFATITCKGDAIGVEHLPDYLTASPAGDPPGDTLKQDERKRVLAALKLNNYNRTSTAKHLGMSRVSLWKRMKKFGLLPDKAAND